jgi:hypothetical protein
MHIFIRNPKVLWILDAEISAHLSSHPDADPEEVVREVCRELARNFAICTKNMPAMLRDTQPRWHGPIEVFNEFIDDMIDIGERMRKDYKDSQSYVENYVMSASEMKRSLVLCLKLSWMSLVFEMERASAHPATIVNDISHFEMTREDLINRMFSTKQTNKKRVRS